RFPENPGVAAARDRLGEYFWEKKAKKLLAESSAGNPDPAQLPEAMRVRYREHLLEALGIYRELDRDLQEASGKRNLEPIEMGVWQKALFSIGRIKMDLEEYGDAFEYFRVLQVRM